MKIFKALEVFMGEEKAGTLAAMKDGRVVFECDEQWLVDRFSISPFSLPLEKKVFIPRPKPFDGLLGVLVDSLPDGWGRPLVDKMLVREGANPYTVGSLNRLAIVGDSGMGVLPYWPAHELGEKRENLDYDRLADTCRELLKTEYAEDLDELFPLEGFSGGARPKIYTTYEGEDWIVKSPSSMDREDTGETEYRYSLCARKCGPEVMETGLFPSQRCAGYSGIKRFDRSHGRGGKKEKVHMASISGLLETSHRVPNLDYHLLMKLVLSLTKDYSQAELLFRQVCFNVFAYSRDDHSKNSTFLYCREENEWRLSPTYDLTYSHSVGGEHVICVDGNGRNPGHKELLKVTDIIGLERECSVRMAKEIEEIAEHELGDLL